MRYFAGPGRSPRRGLEPSRGGVWAAFPADPGLPKRSLTVFDKVNFDEHILAINFFSPPAPPNAALEAGLAEALAHYRERAGRIGIDATGNRVILLTDAGARFVEAVADVTLDTLMPLEPAPALARLRPSGDGAMELLLVQVTRFPCGGLAVGYAMHHAVGDGRATSNFLVSWGQATRGAAISPVPVHDRVSILRNLVIGSTNATSGRLSTLRAPGAVEKEGLVPATDAAEVVLCPDVAVYSQLGFPVYDMDFGGGRPFLHMPSYMPEEGVVFMVPSSSGDGGIDAYVSLFSNAMHVFKSCCYSLPVVNTGLRGSVARL
ncbi:unnamed protein product [Urochloa decumbens]|uniref:Uncharacterized protein n=1 Tax=Urochloa decumbens TaxID=240449 RepID=A0ABC9AQ78_9POAL